jgi:hypothetical protein
VERNPAQTGFVPIPKPWIVKRANGILALHRRLVRDYEHLPRLRVTGALGDDRGITALTDWADRAVLPHRMTGDQLTVGAVLARLKEREREITTRVEEAREQIVQLNELGRAGDRVQQHQQHRLKLKRLTERGIPAETEQACFGTGSGLVLGMLLYAAGVRLWRPVPVGGRPGGLGAEPDRTGVR